MTGPEHYRQAELLVKEGMDSTHESIWPTRLIAAAQVHATLALAAATAMAASDEMPLSASESWELVVND